MIKSFDCGNIDETKRKFFTENFVPQTPENWMLDEVSWVYIKPYLIKYLNKKKSSWIKKPRVFIFIHSKDIKTFCYFVEILGFYI